jgi:O-antigen ligase
MTAAGIRGGEGWAQAVRRAAALAAIVVVLAYPVRAFLLTEDVPVWVRALWPILACLAAWRPGPSLLLFVALTPLLPIVPALQRWPSVSLPALWLFALLVPAWARLAWRGEPPVLPRSAVLFLLLVTSSLVATMAPFAVGEGGAWALLEALHEFLRDDLTTLTGQRHVYASVLAWVVIAEGVGLGWLLFRWLREGGAAAARWLAVAAVAGTSLVAAFGLRQWWTRENLLPFWLEFDPFITRINATFTDVNTLGSHMAAMCVVAVAVACVSRWPRSRAAALVAAVAMGAACVCTASRSAWVATVAGLGVYLATGLHLGLWQTSAVRAALVRRGLAGLAVLLVVGTLALAGYATYADVRHINQRSYVDTLLYTLNARIPLDERLKGRLVLWDTAARITVERPWTGIGIGRFYKDITLHAASPERLPRPQENAHNYFLQLPAEMGVPTLIVWLTLIGVMLRGGWRATRHVADPFGRHMAAAGVGATVAFLVTCLAGQPLLLREGQLTFWLAAALAVGHEVRHWPGGGIRARTILLVAALGIGVWTPWRAVAEQNRVDLARYPAGLYAAETAADGSTFHWSAAKATLFVPEGATQVDLTLRSVAPMSQAVDIIVDGQAVDRVPLDDHAWRDLRYLLPRHVARGRFHRIELRVEPTWRAPADGRTLGVMLKGYRWTPP